MGRFQNWLGTLVETRRTASTLGAWVGMTIVVLGILLSAAYVDPVSRWFHLSFWKAFACFLPMMILGLVSGHAESRGRLSLRAFGFLILLGATLFQFFWAAMTVLCDLPGAFVMAAFFLLTVTLHGYLHRVGSTYPYGLLPTVLAVLTAFLLEPPAANLALLCFLAPTGILLSMLTGMVGLRLHHNIVESDALKQALYYRALNEKAQEHSEMSRRVLDLLKYNHDAGNTLSAVFVHAQLLEERLALEGAKLPGFEELGRAISRLLTQLGRLRTMISSAHRVADEMPVVESVELISVIRDVRSECASLFPRVDIEMAQLPQEQHLAVRVHDGDRGLRRVLQNIMRNACEGNGRAAANRVQISVDRSDSSVCVCLTDDGPGFADFQLAEPPAVLATTKSDGHGLGLYTVNELVVASGGQLHRRNGVGGGAIVEIHLKADLAI